MIPALLLHLSLLSISLVIALILAIAWHEFGRPRHALTWATAFGLTTAMWGLDLMTARTGEAFAGMAPPTLIIAGFASVLNTLGFRQRGGVVEGRAGLLGAAVTQGLLVIGLTLLGVSPVARALPLSLLNAAMFWLAARALTGRRKAERAAARAAQAGLLLLSLLNLTFLISMVGALFGTPAIDLAGLGRLTSLLLPAIVTAIGLFTIILLAADLADQARRLAASDMLTGLLNRRGFDEAARAIIASARRNGRKLALVLIDVDRFKGINDRFGHPAGDRVLCALSDRIAGEIGARDVFARIGGEEFAIVLADVDLTAASRTADVLRQSLCAMAVDLPEPHQVTASFGVTRMREGDDSLAAMMKRADEALYRAKADGRNRVVAAP